MPTNIKIKHPRNHNTLANSKAVPRRFLAVGTASRDIVRVEGKITLQGSGLTPQPVVGETISMVLWGELGQVPKLHWVIMFPKKPDSGPNLGVPPGRYLLEVTGYPRIGSPVSATPYLFDVKAVQSIAADYPVSDQDITEEADYFMAYGTCTHDLDQARMNTSTESIPPDSQDSDVALEVWWALFPPLADGTYELTAVDTWLHPLTNPVTGLVVNRHGMKKSAKKVHAHAAHTKNSRAKGARTKMVPAK